MSPKISSDTAKEIVLNYLRATGKEGKLDPILSPMYSVKYFETDGNVWLVRVIVETIYNSSFGEMRDGYISPSDLTTTEITVYGVSETNPKVVFTVGSSGQRQSL